MAKPLFAGFEWEGMKPCPPPNECKRCGASETGLDLCWQCYKDPSGSNSKELHTREVIEEDAKAAIMFLKSRGYSAADVSDAMTMLAKQDAEKE